MYVYHTQICPSKYELYQMQSKKLLGWAVRSKSKDDKSFLYFTSMHHSYRGGSPGVVNTTKNQTKAKLYHSLDEILKVIKEIRKGKHESDMNIDELKIVKIYSYDEEVNIFEDELLIALQKRAIKKLDDEEIEALGVKDSAFHTKLHGEIKDNIKDFYPDEEIEERHTQLNI